MNCSDCPTFGQITLLSLYGHAEMLVIEFSLLPRSCFAVLRRILSHSKWWCDLGFFTNSRGNKAAANLRSNT